MKVFKTFTMLFFLLILNVNCQDVIDCSKCLLAQETYVNAIENSNGVTSAFRSEYSSVVSLCGQSTADYLLEYWLENGRDGIRFDCD
jgi:hypothetical protein